MFLGYKKVKFNAILLILILILAKIIYNVELCTISFNLNIPNLIFTIVIDILAYTSNLVALTILLIGVPLKSKIQSLIRHKMESLTFGSYYTCKPFEKNKLNNYNSFSQHSSYTTKNLEHISISLAQDKIDISSLSHVITNKLDSDFFIKKQLQGYNTDSELNLLYNQGAYVNYIGDVRSIEHSYLVYLTNSHALHIIKPQLPHANYPCLLSEKYLIPSNRNLDKDYFLSSTDYSTNFNDNFFKPQEILFTDITLNSISNLNTLSLKKEKELFNQVYSSEALRSHAKLLLTYDQKTTLINEELKAENNILRYTPLNNYMLGYRPNIRQSNENNTHNTQEVLNALDLENTNMQQANRPNRQGALNMLDLDIRNRQQANRPILGIRHNRAVNLLNVAHPNSLNDLAVDERRSRRVKGLHDRSGELNIAHTTNFNNLIDQEDRNVLTENIHRVEANYEANVISMESIIEVETLHNLVTLEAEADVTKYYNPVNGNLRATVIRPLTREELNSDLNTVVTDINIDDLDELSN